VRGEGKRPAIDSKGSDVKKRKLKKAIVHAEMRRGVKRCLLNQDVCIRLHKGGDLEMEGDSSAICTGKGSPDLYTRESFLGTDEGRLRQLRGSVFLRGGIRPRQETSSSNPRKRGT